MEDSTCEICGRKNVKAVVSVEGAKLVVCGGCARGKKILYYLEDREMPSDTHRMDRPRQKMEETEEIVEDYADRIKTARQKMGLPISVVAEKINEMESYLERIERGKVMPTFSVAKKLEKELSIKLIEKVEASVAPSDTGTKKKFSAPTLGDLLESQEE